MKLACIAVLIAVFLGVANGQALNTSQLTIRFNTVVSDNVTNSFIQTASAVIADIGLVYIRLAPCAQRELHNHPRGNEVSFVVKGSLVMGVLLENNTAIEAPRNVGEAFVFPQGLFHFIYNPNCEEAFYYSALSSSNAGTVNAPTNFASLPEAVVKGEWEGPLPRARPGLLTVNPDCEKRCAGKP